MFKAESGKDDGRAVKQKSLNLDLEGSRGAR
jgi:hypothetical protein